MMNKNILSIFLILLSLSAKGQQVPNGSFEQWFFNNNTQSYEPTGWSTSNLGIYGDTGVYKHTPARTGNFACGLQTHFVLSTFTVPGMLSTTFPITTKPKWMELYFKGNIALNDTSIIIVQFGQDTNIIADGSLFITQSQNTYTKFNIPIDFFGSGDPDSCTITILSGGFEIDDTLTSIAIDDISFYYPVDVKSVYYGAKDNINLYPNPNSGNLGIEINPVQKRIQLRIFNLEGVEVSKIEYLLDLLIMFCIAPTIVAISAYCILSVK